MDERRRKIQFRAWRRGFRELDLLMGSFADQTLAGLNEDEVTEFERLLGLPDWELYAWIVGQKVIPDNQRSALLDRLIAFRFTL
jgi:antitoxin CptB